MKEKKTSQKDSCYEAEVTKSEKKNYESEKL